MLKLSLKVLRSTVLAGIGAISAAHGTPLDSPDTIYVDGKPCGSFCQSYLGINRADRQVEQAARRAPARSTAVHHDRLAKVPKREARRAVGKSGAPPTVPMPVARLPESKRPLSASTTLASPRSNATPAGSDAADVNEAANRPAVMPPPAGSVDNAGKPSVVNAMPALEVNGQNSLRPDKAGNEAELASQGTPPNAQQPSEPRPAEISSEKLAALDGKTNASPVLTDAIRDQTPTNATSPTSVPSPMEAAGSLDRQVQAGTTSSATVETAPKTDFPTATDPASAASSAVQPSQEAPSPDRREQLAALSSPPRAVTSKIEEPAPVTAAERRVAVIMVRPEILSISDLASKDIAIDVRQAPSRDNVRSALATAGASGTNLTDGGTKALDRLLGGEVPAAVLAVLSASAAENFPNIAGFRLFRIPLAAN